MFEAFAKLIGKMALGIGLIIVGLNMLVAGFGAGYLARDHSDSTFNATGGERLSGGGTARPGERIHQLGYIITPLANIVLGFVLPGLGLYLTVSSVSGLWALRKARKFEPEPSAKPPVPVRRYSVRLIDCGKNRIDAIKIIRDVKELGISASAEITDSLPATIGSDLDARTAEKLLKRFTDAGVRAEIVENPT